MPSVQITRVKLEGHEYLVDAEPFPKWQRLITLREPHPQRVYYATWRGLGVWRWRPKVTRTMWIRVAARDELDAYNKVMNWKETKDA